MTLLRYPLKFLARGIVALQQWTEQRWRNPVDRLRGFLFLGWAIGFVEAALCAALFAGVMGVGWVLLGGSTDNAFIIFLISFLFMHVSFLLICMVDARSYLPLSVWMERRICDEWEIEKRHELDNTFFEVAAILTGVHMGAKTDVSRMELARIAFTTQFFLWALDPVVQRQWQARSMRLSHSKPTSMETSRRL